jgi:hypothetical protein
MATEAVIINSQVNSYIKNLVANRYIYDPGTLPIPLGIPPDQTQNLGDLGTFPIQPPSVNTVEIVQVSAPTLFRVMTFELLRLGDMPDIPNTLSDNPSEQLVSAEVTTYSPTPNEDGTKLVYGASGRYVFVLSDPVTWPEGLEVPKTPTSGGVQLTSVNSSDLYQP